MSRRLTRQRNQVKGAFFEVLVRNLLLKAGYEPLEPDDISIRSMHAYGRGKGLVL